MWTIFVKSLSQHGYSQAYPRPNQGNRAFKMSPSEVMTLVIWFHNSNARNFKHFYMEDVPNQLGSEFPSLVSYNRLIELKQSILIPLCAYLHSRRIQSDGIAFVDATSLAVCHNRRISRHKTFANVARRGKTSKGWFYGFKLHLVIHDCGELISFYQLLVEHELFLLD